VGQRKRTYDLSTREAVQVKAHDEVVEHDETLPLETANNSAETLGAAATFADQFHDTTEDPYAAVEMILHDSEKSQLFVTQEHLQSRTTTQMGVRSIFPCMRDFMVGNPMCMQYLVLHRVNNVTQG
jgi:hypothetical protein